ncbi:hypothetical protein JAAARDRAFT_40202 [Jaapia argillacea MUCL 33604]|uniref:Uncharacterized protein n=1 Tax=Jaapia argillacea MUCL 33604 TaxID=933084 RepID=A0A067PCF0_9AGAM|nr:hypothetical protein JAAARDRAFT_40202 [Jaapia argillacea MUCL 33604]
MARQQRNSGSDNLPSQHSSPTDQQQQEGYNSRTGSALDSHKPSPISREATTGSEREEGYPSWLPKRPPPPAPASTYTSVGMATPVAELIGERDTDSPDPFAFVGGRKPTPRSVRIVSMQSQAEKDAYGRGREPTDQSRVSRHHQHQHARVWSRATTSGMTPTLFSRSPAPLQAAVPSPPRPRFRATGLHLELLRNPSWRSRLHYYLYPLFVFYDIPLQTFFDFNAVFIILQVAKFPTPAAPGVPGSGRNWALGAAAYIAAWAVWLFVVFIIYQLIYSFYRRWRVKRPLMLPLYMSSPAFNVVCLTSYTNFSFFQHLRTAAYKPEQEGSIRDGLSELCYWYSQNWPTVALLLPRAGLALALLLTFGSPQSGGVTLGELGGSGRDQTFFRADGTLTGYGRGILIANAAWTAWRVLVLLASWLGLWILSGQLCGGLCGPRYRWEEEEMEKTQSVYSEAGSEVDAIPWSWKECTRLRVQEAYEFCLTTRRSSSRAEKKEVSEIGLGPPVEPSQPPTPFPGMDQVLAAIGLPTGGVPYPPKRGVLSEELFETPDASGEGEEGGEKRRKPELLSDILPPPPVMSEKGKERAVGGLDQGPLMQLPYPFTGYGAQISSEDQTRVPFPPSPGPEESDHEVGDEEGGEEDDEEEEDEEGQELEVEEHAEGTEAQSSPSARARSSASMSSLGRPVTSRYPFQFRRPHGRGQSVSSASHHTPATHSSNSRSTPSSGNTRSTQSTGNRPSTDRGSSPRSHLDSSPDVAGIPLPPRHPGQGRRRAGTVPSLPSSPSPVVFADMGGVRMRTESDDTGASQSVIHHHDFPAHLLAEMYETSEDEDGDMMMEQPEAEGSQEAAEIEDSVGLLTSDAGQLSPRSSLGGIRHRTGVSPGRRRNGSRSNSSGSRSRTSSSARSRAQSLIQSISAASRSSLELVANSMGMRSRTDSMARLDEVPSPDPERARTDSDAHRSERSHSGSGSASEVVLSSPENHTFGHPLREQFREDAVEESEDEVPDSQTGTSVFESAIGSPMSLSPPQHDAVRSRSGSSAAVSVQRSERTVLQEPAGRPILYSPGTGPSTLRPGTRPRVRSAATPRQQSESPPDISTAAQSFVTAPVSITGTSETTVGAGRTPESWGGVAQFLGEEGRPERFRPV